MISVNGYTNEYVLDLNDSLMSHRELSVSSSAKWMIPYVSSSSIKVYSSPNDTLNIDVDLEGLNKDGLIILRNSRKENIRIVLKPNLEMSREKNYIFRLGRHTIDGNKIKLNVISKENGIYEPWEITKDGAPITYEIRRTSTTVTLTWATMLAIEYTSIFEFTQINSDKKIHFMLRHKNNNSVELIEEKD